MAMERIFTSYGLCHIARTILFNLESSEIINFRLVCKSLKREIDKPEMWLEKDKSNKSIWNRVFQELSASLDDIDLKSKLSLLLCSISQKSNLNHNYLIYPLCVAFRKKKFDLTKEILQKLGTPKIVKLVEKDFQIFDAKDMFYAASSLGYVEIAKLMMIVVTSFQDPSICYNYRGPLGNINAIEIATRNGHYEIVKMFLCSKMFPEKELKSPIRIAIDQQNFEILKILIESITPITDLTILTPEVLDHAVGNGSIEIVEFLLKYLNPPIDEDYQGLVNIAVRHDNEPMIRMLMKDISHDIIYKALWDEATTFKYLPIQEAIKEAIRSQDFSILKLLLSFDIPKEELIKLIDWVTKTECYFHLSLYPEVKNVPNSKSIINTLLEEKALQIAM